MQHAEPQLICLIGAECTGKTTLAQHLAQTLAGVWVPERLRLFCDAQGRTPFQSEQASILELQAQDEQCAIDEARRQSKFFVFCDTAPLLTAIYSDYVFKDTALYPRARQLHSRYHRTLVLEPDLPWIADGMQRDGAHVRRPIHARILEELRGLHVPFESIAGMGASRSDAAQAALHHQHS